MKLCELFHDNLDELTIDNSHTARPTIDGDIQRGVMAAIRAQADNDGFYRLAKKAETKKGWTTFLNLNDQMEKVLKPYFQRQEDIGKAEEFVEQLVDRSMITKELDRLRTQKTAKVQKQIKTSKNWVQKIADYAKKKTTDMGHPTGGEPVMQSLYAEGNNLQSSRVWQIQWAMTEDGEDDYRPQHIFAKNRNEAMQKFAERFSRIDMGSVQIESIKEVEWNF